MYEENRLKLGIFVLLGMSLFIGFIFFLGLRTALEPKLRFHTMFDESVQGLEVGSPVKFKGVTIGSVADIKILRSNKKIRVDMDVNPNTIDYEPKEDDTNNHTDPLTLQIECGLCCQLQMTGITGMKFIEIDYFKNPEHFNKGDKFEPGFIPPGISVFQNTVVSVSEALSKIAKVDFEGISNDLRLGIQSINKLADSPELKAGMIAAKEAVVEINKAIARLNLSAEKGKISRIIAKLNKTLDSIDSMSLAIKKQVDDANLGEISQRVQKSLDKLSEIGTDTSKTVSDSLKILNITMTEIKDLVDLLEEDPSSLLRGKLKEDRFAE